MKFNKDIIIVQIDNLLDEYQFLEKRVTGSSIYKSDIKQKSFKFISRGLALIERVVGNNSSYWIKTQYELDNTIRQFGYQKISIVAGALEALKDDVKADLLTTVSELIHADIFTDFLEMAEYLLTEEYKDAAAVMIGSVLEGHIRKLCIKNQIKLVIVKDNGDQVPKKLDLMNSDLAKSKIYTKIDQKSVTSWYGLRTDAAHGNYDNYLIEQVRLMLHGVTDFIRRNPA